MAGGCDSSRIVLAKIDFKKTEKVACAWISALSTALFELMRLGDPPALGYAQGVYRITPDTAGSAMQQVAAWLQKLGLGQYAQRFAENDISFSILPHLTDLDLKELGVTSLRTLP